MNHLVKSGRSRKKAPTTRSGLKAFSFAKAPAQGGKAGAVACATTGLNIKRLHSDLLYEFAV
jgi:hypothetical protein